MENMITILFDVESEAYQAFSELSHQPWGEGYVVAEAALLKHEGDALIVVDAFDATGTTSDDTVAGVCLGAIVGILGGPVGMLLGAGIGGAAGAHADRIDAINNASLLEMSATRLYEGEVAVVALVGEDEPAFDAALAGYQVTIIRQFAADVAEEVVLAREIEAEMLNVLYEGLRAERAAERQSRREARREAVRNYFARLAERRQEIVSDWHNKRLGRRERIRRLYDKAEEAQEIDAIPADADGAEAAK